MISFRQDPRPNLDAIRALYAAAPLRRPIGDPERIQRMFDGAQWVLSAWDGERLVGLLRALTDGVYDGYVCDLAVHPEYQKRGVGRGLLDRLRQAGPGIKWLLLASPMAKDYYQHLGWQSPGNAWQLERGDGPMPEYAAYQAEFAELARRA